MSMPCTLFAILAFLPSSAQVWGQESSALRGASEQPQQVLVFDAGSSGTRIHIFNLLPGAKESLVPRIDLAVRDAQTKKIKPGLSSFATNSDFAGAEKNIQQLMEFANQFVPAERRSSTPALLKATAGLRSVQPAEKADAVLQRVRETLALSGYLFKPEWADIIKGKEEAGLAWVAANYLQGNFDKVPSGASSLGVIEMGGGSTQVTFEVSPSEASRVVDPDSFVFNTLVGSSYHLYAHSYLGYGQDHAQAKMRSLMQSVEVEDPCYSSGYLRQSAEDDSKIISGTGNSESCLELIKSRLLASSELTAPGRYADEISLRGHFLATENFFYVRNELQLSMDGSITSMKEAAKTGCETPLNPSTELEAAMRAGTADPFKQKGCFGLSYQVALLEALRAGTLPGIEVKIARNINGGDIDWALGAALVHFIDSGMGKQADFEIPSQMETMDIGKIVVVFLLLLGGLGAARFYVQKRSCTKQALVGEITSAVKATTVGGSRWMEIAQGAKQHPDPPE